MIPLGICLLILTVGLDNVSAAISTLRVYLLQIDAKRSVPQEQKPKSKKIFVGGLAPETSEGILLHQTRLVQSGTSNSSICQQKYSISFVTIIHKDFPPLTASTA